jgi:hypothetical protein
MRTQWTLAALAVLVCAAPAQAGLSKRLVKSAGRVAGKAIVHAQQAENAATTANEPTQGTQAPETAPPRSVAGVSAITTPAGSAPAVQAATPAPAVASTFEDTAPAPKTVDAFGDSVEALPPTLRENSYFYSSFGTQDPFRSLLAGDFTPKLQELVDLHTVQLVGVIWEPDEVVAMVQDAQGYGYALRPGDTVKNGSVVAVRQDALVARLNIFGQTTQVTLRLQHEEE